MVISTSAGITLPRSGSTRCRTFSATAMALVPLRFEIAMRDGRIESFAVGEAHVLRRLFAAIGDVARRRGRRPACRWPHPTTTLRTSSAVRRNSPVSSRNSLIAAAKLPDGRRRLEAPSAPAHLQRRRDRKPPAAPGSSVTRISRRWPPISATAETSGVCLIDVVHLRRDAPQLEIAVAFAPEASAPESAHRRSSAA